MPDKLTLVLLFGSVAAVLYVYGVAVLRRMGQVMQHRTGAEPPRILSPYCGGELVRAYRDLAASTEEHLPRLHRSIGLNRVLLAVVVVAGAVRLML